jgi:anionic cell wall polymer biosynthesis LytR-Cps2A-Psr (LCP) family protein
MIKNMNLKTVSLLCLFVFFLTFIITIQNNTAVHLKTALISPLAYTQGTDLVLGLQIEQTGQKVQPVVSNSFIQTPINILLLGLDSRIGDTNPRCDAIHIFTIDPLGKQITITSIPRGTPLTYAGLQEDTIIANACHTYGKDFAIAQIEKIAGIKVDYVVKVGFSQTLGVLRTLGLPTTPTLQFLRNRKYAIGDNQRSRNQAQFLKDQIVSHLKYIRTLPKPVQYVAYKTLDTDLDFDLASAILKTVDELGITSDASRITLVSKPNLSPYIKELHLEQTDLSDTSWMNDVEYKTYQNEISTYIENLIIRAGIRLSSDPTSAHKLIEVPFTQKLWLQIENEQKRNQYHFDILKLYVSSSNNIQQETAKVLDFISEMDTVKNSVLKQKAQEYLDSLISS